MEDSLLYFLLLRPDIKEENMKLRELFPTFSAIYDTFKPKRRRSLAERIEELEGLLRAFLPYGVAIRVCSRLFQREPDFDLQAPKEENTRYWISRAISDFQWRLERFSRQYGYELTDELVEGIKQGTYKYLPTFLPRLIVQ